MTDFNPALNFALPLPITQTALQTARCFAQRQPSPEKAVQVRLNTLAVCVMHDYLQMMGIATNPTAGESWNAVTQLSADVADLEVSGLGKLECRPLTVVESSRSTCPIPPEVWHDRIGYVVVEIDEATQNAYLIGFTETAAVEELALSQLQPPENLLDHLDQLFYASQPAVSDASGSSLTVPTWSNLGQWLQNTFETGWQTVESLLSDTGMQPAYGFRGNSSTSAREAASVQQAKEIRLDSPTGQRSLYLIVEVNLVSNEDININIQVFPTPDQIYLPEKVRLAILDSAGALFLEAQARAVDNYIQLNFSGSPGEEFAILVELGESNVIEYFVI